MKEIIRQEMKNKPLGPFLEAEQRKGNTLANCFEGYIDEFTLSTLAQRHEIYPDNNSEEMFDEVFDNYCDAMLEVLTELYPEHKEVWAQHFE